MPPSWKASSAAEKDRTISFRPGTGARAFSLRTSETPERCETINSDGNFEAARFGAELDLFRRAHRLGDDVVAAEAEALSAAIAVAFIIAPVALGAAGRERVAGHEVAVLKGALGLIVQRRADVLDRVDEVQAVGEQLAGRLPSRAARQASAPRTARDRAAARYAPGRSVSPAQKRH